MAGAEPFPVEAELSNAAERSSRHQQLGLSPGLNLPGVCSDVLNRGEHSVHSSDGFYSFSTLDELVMRKMKTLAFFFFFSPN